MATFIIFIIFCGVTLCLLVLSLPLYYKNIKDPIEIGSKLIYEETCGIRIGNFSMSYGYVKLRMYENFFVISFIKRIIINYEDIYNFKREKLLFHKLIIYLKNDFPGFFLVPSFNRITIYAGDINKISQILQKNNVQELKDYTKI